jgi:predicted nucleic-acid-binding protein
MTIATLTSKDQTTQSRVDTLDATEVQFEDEPVVEEALFTWKDSAADFADCLIGAHHHRVESKTTATFDAKAAKLPTFVAL